MSPPDNPGLGPSVSPTMVPPAPEYVDAFLADHPPQSDDLDPFGPDTDDEDTAEFEERLNSPEECQS